MLAMAMAELKALLRIQPKTLTDLDVAAAEQLVQLSSEDNGNDNKSRKKKNKRKDKNENDFEDEEKFDRSSQTEITLKMIEEIFGKEEEVAPPRKKRYRSLVSVYQATEFPPMNNVWFGKKASIAENPSVVLATVAEANRYWKTPAVK